MQDGGSYRYGIVSLGGRDRDDVIRKFERCRTMLNFTLTDVDRPANAAPLEAAGG